MSKVSQTIEKLISATENSTVDWDVMSKINDTKQIKSIDQLIRKNKYEEDFNVLREDSFVAKHKNSYFVFLTVDATDAYNEDIEYLVLAIQATNESELVELNALGEEQSQLFRLKNMVVRQVKGVNKVLDDFLDDIF